MFKRTILLLFILMIPFSWYVIAISEPENPLVSVWKELDVLFTPIKTECPEEDSWLPEQGILGFYCHVKARLDYAALVKLAGMPAFTQGPHSAEGLNLRDPYQFGHYNPEFVQWLRDNLLPAKNSPAIRELTQPFYERYLQQRARTWYVVQETLAADPLFFQAELSAYQAFLTAKEQATFGRDYYYYAKLPEQGYSEYEVDSAVRFWMRREIDGTRAIFTAGLRDLLQLYDSAFVEAQSQSNNIHTEKADTIKCVEDVMKAVRQVFPEAYTQFMQVTYEWQDVGEIWPVEASFYIPARFFPTPLSDQALHQRLTVLVTQVTRENDAHCERLDVAEPETRSWLGWPDKTVRKVTIQFKIGC